jgi:hypothetical protein
MKRAVRRRSDTRYEVTALSSNEVDVRPVFVGQLGPFRRAAVRYRRARKKPAMDARSCCLRRTTRAASRASIRVRRALLHQPSCEDCWTRQAWAGQNTAGRAGLPSRIPTHPERDYGRPSRGRLSQWVDSGVSAGKGHGEDQSPVRIAASRATAAALGDAPMSNATSRTRPRLGRGSSNASPSSSFALAGTTTTTAAGALLTTQPASQMLHPGNDVHTERILFDRATSAVLGDDSQAVPNCACAARWRRCVLCHVSKQPSARSHPNRCVDARLMNEQSIRHEMDQLRTNCANRAIRRPRTIRAASSCGLHARGCAMSCSKRRSALRLRLLRRAQQRLRRLLCHYIRSFSELRSPRNTSPTASIRVAANPSHPS